jgi:hypothetical protein
MEKHIGSSTEHILFRLVIRDRHIF